MVAKKEITIFIIILVTLFIFPTAINAQSCSGTPDDGQGCQNGGNLTNGCNWICNEVRPNIKYVIPPCCETLAQTGDPFACCFDARRRCTPDQCASISGPQQRCGQLWTGDWNCPQTMQPLATPTPAGPPFVGCTLSGDWLCMCYYNNQYLHDCAPANSEPQTASKTLCGGDLAKAEKQWRYDVSKGFTGKGDCCGGQNVCRTTPTTPPTPPPTSVPVVVPTTPPAAPTSIMLPLPYLTVTVAPAKPTPDLFSPGNINQNNRPSFSFSLPSLPQLPNVQLPCVNLRLSVASANIIAQKPLSVLRNIFVSIRQMDKKMEKVIEEKMTKIANQIFPRKN